jgi:hypothetical protein
MAPFLLLLSSYLYPPPTLYSYRRAALRRDGLAEPRLLYCFSRAAAAATCDKVTQEEQHQQQRRAARIKPSKRIRKYEYIKTNFSINE